MSTITTPNDLDDALAVARTADEEKTIHPGDVVRVGGGRALWQVIAEEADRFVCVTQTRGIEVRHARSRVTLLYRRGDPVLAWHALVCVQCLDHRWLSFSDGSRWMHCPTCDRSTVHDNWDRRARCDFGEEENERKREALAANLRALDESLDMLEQLGVRVAMCEDLVAEGQGIVFRVTAERGRGRTTWFIELASNLSIADQVTYLGVAWQEMLPANQPIWLENWDRCRDDPALERLTIVRPAGA